jgi:hypothetical protein
MNINHKQQQLMDELFEKVKVVFPEIKYVDYEFSPDDPQHIWMNVLTNMDEDRQIELMEYSAELEVDILMDYGYRISIMPENPNFILA